ncbi:MAG TPA: hypothetical protein PKD60_13415, partial [Turneriella sp.]|nr:hypothetical protein [Turneriella sp.]
PSSESISALSPPVAVAASIVRRVIFGGRPVERSQKKNTHPNIKAASTESMPDPPSLMMAPV